MFESQLFFVPESPIHLLRKEKIQSAENICMKIYGTEYDVQTHLAETKLSLESNNEKSCHIFASAAVYYFMVMLIVQHSMQGICAMPEAISKFEKTNKRGKLNLNHPSRCRLQISFKYVRIKVSVETQGLDFLWLGFIEKTTFISNTLS